MSCGPPVHSKAVGGTHPWTNAGVTGTHEACSIIMHLTLRMVHNFPKAVVYRIPVPYAQNGSQSPSEQSTRSGQR